MKIKIHSVVIAVVLAVFAHATIALAPGQHFHDHNGTLRAGYQGGLMWEGREVARIECRIAPTDKSLRNTKVTLAKSAGAYVIEQVQIAGEHVRHGFTTASRLGL